MGMTSRLVWGNEHNGYAMTIHKNAINVWALIHARESKRVQKYLFFIIKSYYQFFLNPILVLKTMVMVSRPNFGRVGYLRGPEWAPNEHKTIFLAFFVYFCGFLLISLVLSNLCDWNYWNTIHKGLCSNEMADFEASRYFWGPWTSIISTFCLYFGIFGDFLILSLALSNLCG